MADNVSITAGSGTPIAADDIGPGVWYQRVKQTLGRDGVATADQAGRDLGSGDGASYVDPRPYRQSFVITPVISAAPAYTSGDCLGGLNTISNAARVSGYGGVIQSITVLDKTQAQRAAMSLLFFKASVTSAGDNAAAAFSDADMGNLVAMVEILTADYNTAWPGVPLNSVAYKPNTATATWPQSMSIPYTCSGGTSLYMQAVVRGTPTYTSTSDIVITLNCVLD